LDDCNRHLQFFANASCVHAFQKEDYLNTLVFVVAMVGQLAGLEAPREHIQYDAQTTKLYRQAAKDAERRRRALEDERALVGVSKRTVPVRLRRQRTPKPEPSPEQQRVKRELHRLMLINEVLGPLHRNFPVLTKQEFALMRQYEKLHREATADWQKAVAALEEMQKAIDAPDRQPGETDDGYRKRMIQNEEKLREAVSKSFRQSPVDQ
jgi:uncharacterized protein with von Willebrand factor type A (vWA) domain